MATRRTTAEQVGRFYELREEVPIPEDYVLTEKIRIKNPSRKQMIEFWDSVGQDRDRALLGDQADAVFALYENEPNQLFQRMINDLLNHFFGTGADDEGKSDEPSA